MSNVVTRRTALFVKRPLSQGNSHKITRLNFDLVEHGQRTEANAQRTFLQIFLNSPAHSKTGVNKVDQVEQYDEVRIISPDEAARYPQIHYTDL